MIAAVVFPEVKSVGKAEAPFFALSSHTEGHSPAAGVGKTHAVGHTLKVRHGLSVARGGHKGDVGKRFTVKPAASNSEATVTPTGNSQ